MDAQRRFGNLGFTLPAALVALSACGSAPDAPLAAPPPPAALSPAATPPLSLPPEQPPLGRLPPDMRPARYRIELRVDPARPRFEGMVDIVVELDRLRDVVWMHGRDLAVTRVTVQPEGFAPIPARWEQVSKSGVVALRPDAPIGPGRAVVHVEYSAAFAPGDEGLMAVVRGGDHYAFSQLEATYARRVFPSFDEPGFKTPYEIVVHVPRGSTAVSNTREIARTAEVLADPAAPAGQARPFERIAFAVTEKLPSYLVALAVGPLDVVDAPPVPPNAVRSRPLPLRGVATRGRGKELSYAIAHAGALVTALEGYFGLEYPYDKLDLIAVPEMGGAMENAGAITFSELSLLFDERTATAEQRGRFALYAAHEISHQWFGDLVTTAWWDDIWLNEAFAQWAEARIASQVFPDLPTDARALGGVYHAMGDDSLVSARKIRQEIQSDDDIENAFDSITYEKGAAVIGMFERWMGAEVFRRGIHAHLAAHRHGTATSADLLGALSAAAGRDVATPFRTFLDQPGLPFVEARLSCEGAPKLLIKQSRYLPLGSTGGDERTWQMPVCARYPHGKKLEEACTLLTEKEGVIPLETAKCPAWVMPNADAAGYYRWSLPPAEIKRLAAGGLASLSVRERMSFADSITAGFMRGKVAAPDALAALAPLAADPKSGVAVAPMEILASLRDWLYADPARGAVEAYARKLYGPVYKALGWNGKKGEDPDRALLRQEVIEFLAMTARDPAVRREAAARGRAWAEGKGDAVGLDLLGTALAVAAEEGDAALFDVLVKRLATEQGPRERKAIVQALGSASRPELAARARALILDSSSPLAVLERIRPLRAQIGRPDQRDAAWDWVQKNIDALLARLPETWGGAVTWLPVPFCDDRRAVETEKLFGPRAASLAGGPRALAGAVEELRLCAARRAAQEGAARAFFKKKR